MPKVSAKGASRRNWAERRAYEKAWREANKKAQSAYKSAWHAKNRDKNLAQTKKNTDLRMLLDPAKEKARQRGSYLKCVYGLSLDDWEKLFAGQDGLCAICQGLLPVSGQRVHTDHDHKTNKIRGLLCNLCNKGLGHFRDDPTLLMWAAKYLINHGRPAYGD